jgi:hypothetical protein
MLYQNADALRNSPLGHLLPKQEVSKETLYVKTGIENGIASTTVSDKDGKPLFTSVYDFKTGSDTMLVTDYRTGRTKREPISVSNGLSDAESDMRKLGYITENQTLAWKR